MARTTSILDDVETPGDFVEGGKFDIGYFGMGGAGKTRLLHTLKGRGLVLYTPSKEGESGKIVLKKWGNRIKIKTINHFDDYRPVYEALRDENPKRPPDKRYDWVAFDSATGGVQLAKQKVLDRRPPKVRAKKLKIQGTEWGAIADMIDDDLIQPFKSLPISTIWIGQEKDRRRRRHGKIMMDVTPGALGSILPAVLFMGRLYVKQDAEGYEERWMRLGSLDSIATKYRAADDDLEVPQIIKEPHLGKLIRYLYADAGTECPFEEAFESEEEEQEGDLEEVEEAQEATSKTKTTEGEEDDDLEEEED